jgi:hypothetical protein
MADKHEADEAEEPFLNKLSDVGKPLSQLDVSACPVPTLLSWFAMSYLETLLRLAAHRIPHLVNGFSEDIQFRYSLYAGDYSTA